MTDAEVAQNESYVLAAKVIAITVRNAMEDFHAENLTDEQMAVLNPIIRNAIYTGLFAIGRMSTDGRCAKWVHTNLSLLPPYWEEPQFLDAFREFLAQGPGEADEDQ